MTAAPTPTPRDRAEQFIHTAAGRLGSPIRLNAEAAKIARSLAKKDPAAWQDFVDEVIGEVIVSRLRSYLATQRTAALHAKRHKVFGSIVSDTHTAATTGEALPSPYDIQYAMPGTNDWRLLGTLTRPDLLAISASRAKLARSNAIEAIFLNALAGRLPDDTTTVAEALTEDDIVTLHAKADGADLGDLPTTPDTDKE